MSLLNFQNYKLNLIFPLLACLLGNAAFYFCSGFLLTGEPFLHKEAMLQYLNAVSLTMPDMSLFEAVWENSMGFFECYFLDQGRGRFRYIGYLYESITANMIFLGYLPMTLYDTSSLAVISVASLFLSLIVFARTKSTFLAFSIVVLFLVSFPTLMIYEFHYRGAKVMAVLFLAIFLWLFNSGIDSRAKKFGFGLTIILGYLSDPFFVVASLAFVAAHEILVSKERFLDFTRSHVSARKPKELFNTVFNRKTTYQYKWMILGFVVGIWSGSILLLFYGTVIGYLVSTNFKPFRQLQGVSQQYFICATTAFAVVVLIQTSTDLFMDGPTCSILLGINNANIISKIDNIFFVHLIPVSLLSIKHWFFGLLFFGVFIYLTYQQTRRGKNPFLLLGCIFAFVLISQLWPIKNVGLTYPSYYGIVPQLLLCLFLTEAFRVYWKRGQRWPVSLSCVLLLILNYMNIASWNPYKDVFYAWRGGHISKVQRKLWEENGAKHFSALNALSSSDEYQMVVPEFGHISYSHKYDDPEYERHQEIAELDAIIPLYFSSVIAQGRVKTIPSAYSTIPAAKEIEDTTADAFAGIILENTKGARVAVFQIEFPDGVFNGRIENDKPYLRNDKPYRRGAVLPSRSLAGMTAKTIAVLTHQDLDGSEKEICRVDIPPYRDDPTPSRMTYQCDTDLENTVGVRLKKVRLEDATLRAFNLIEG